MAIGYTDRPVKELETESLLEEALQSAYDSGYYSAVDPYSDQHNKAIARRNETF